MTAPGCLLLFVNKRDSLPLYPTLILDEGIVSMLMEEPTQDEKTIAVGFPLRIHSRLLFKHAALLARKGEGKHVPTLNHARLNALNTGGILPPVQRFTAFFV